MYRKPRPQARLRLFCFPYAGGGASVYRTWGDDLPPAVEVCPVQLPGRESRMSERAYTNIDDLVAAAIPVLTPFFDRPFALFGHSMGSLIAFELARALRDRGGPQPLHLFASGHRAPQLSKDEAPIYNLPEDQFIEELRQFNGTPELVLQNAELMTLLLPVLRADFELVGTYQVKPGPPLSIPISAFGGVDDHEVSPEALAAWQAETAGPFSRRLYPGDHFFIHSARDSLLRDVSADLTRLLQRLP
jgi:medium-chain acyl-[acyl-carrier-protein] hydrolase